MSYGISKAQKRILNVIKRTGRITPGHMLDHHYSKLGKNPDSTAKGRMMILLENRGLVARLSKRYPCKWSKYRRYSEKTLAWFLVRGKRPVIPRKSYVRKLFELDKTYEYQHKLVWRFKGKEYERTSKNFVCPPTIWYEMIHKKSGYGFNKRYV